LAPAQGTLRVSNIGQTPNGNGLVGSDSWIAQSFFILASEPDDYTLDTVDLLMNTATGSPSGFEVSIYSGIAGGAPETYLGSLSGDSDPSAAGIYSYTASGITLTAAVGYFVVVTSATPSTQGAYDWSASDSFTQTGRWVINNQYAKSSNGLSWQPTLRQEVFQMALYATPVPEPAAATLLVSGAVALGCARWRRIAIDECHAEPDAAPEPPPAAAVLESSETMNPKPKSQAPADGGGR
jgi:hypothetical protein